MGYIIFAILLGLEFKTTRAIYKALFNAGFIYLTLWFLYQMVKDARIFP